MKKLLVVLKDSRDTLESSISYLKLAQILDAAAIPLADVILCHPGNVARCVRDETPNVIVPMGADAYGACTDGELTIGAARGEWDTSVFGVKMVPTYAPGFVFSNWDVQETIQRDLMKAYRSASSPEFPLMLGEYLVVRTLEEARELAEFLKSEKYVAFDIETEGFDLFANDEILCVQFSSRVGEGFVLPLRGAWRRHDSDVYSPTQQALGFWRFDEQSDGRTERVLSKTAKNKVDIIQPAFPKGSIVCRTPEEHDRLRGALKSHVCRGYLTDVWGGPNVIYDRGGRMDGKSVPSDYVAVRDILQDILEAPNTKVAFNGNFDCKGLYYQLGINVRGFTIDPMLQYHQFHEVGPHNLEFVRSRFTDMPKYDQWKKVYLTHGRKSSFAEAPNEVLWEYGAADADVELRLVDTFFDEIERENPGDGLWLFNNVDMPFNRTLRQTEINGMLIDPKRFDELCDIYKAALAKLSQQIDTVCRDHGVTPLAAYNNAHTLRPFLYEGDYEAVVRPEKVLVCKPCKGGGKAILRDHRGLRLRNDDGSYQESTALCSTCEGTGKNVIPAVTRPMRGMNFPAHLVERSDETDEQKTDAKALTALRSYCNETKRYATSKITKKNGEVKTIRRLTSSPLSARELTRRAWMRDLLELVGHWKQAYQAINLFLDGSEDRENRELSQGGAKAMLKHIRSDGRIHSQYKQLTKTGRTSSSEPNVENISNETEYFKGQGIRTMFVAPPGYDFGEADYSSQELRVLAYLANEDVLHDILMSCETCGENFRPTEEDKERPFRLKPHLALTGHSAYDVHRSMAARAFKVPYEDVTPQQRTFAKRVTFGINYGQSDYGLAIVLGVGLDEAKAIITAVLDAQPQVKRFQEAKRRQVRRGVPIVNAYGRKRRFFGVNEMKPFVQGYDYLAPLGSMERQGVNFPVQSSPADIIGNVAPALWDVWGVEREDWRAVESLVIAYELMGGQHPSIMLRDMGARPTNVVYDSTEFESPKENRKEVGEVVEFIMERLPWEQLNWYLPVDLQFGDWWGQAKTEKK